MIKEIFTAIRKTPQPRPLRMHQRAVMLILGLCISLLSGWLVLGLIRGRHYVIFLLLLFPVFVALKVGGLLLRGALMPCHTISLSSGIELDP